MYRVVTKSKTDGTNWKKESDYEFDTKDGAEFGLNSFKRNTREGEYFKKYDIEILLDSPTAICYHSKLKNDASWSGITRLVYIEEVA